MGHDGKRPEGGRRRIAFPAPLTVRMQKVDVTAFAGRGRCTGGVHTNQGHDAAAASVDAVLIAEKGGSFVGRFATGPTNLGSD